MGKQLSPELLAQVFMDAVDPIIIQDLDGNVIEMNREAEHAYGWRRVELIGKPIKTIVPPERHSQTDDLVVQCQNGKIIRNIEGYRWNCKNEIFPVLLSLFLIKDTNREAVAIATISKNISEQKKVEKNLKSITRVFQSILDNVSICVNTIDGDGVIIQSSGSGLTKMGLSGNQLVGSRFRDLYADGGKLLARVNRGEIVTFLQSGDNKGDAYFFQHTLFPREDTEDGNISIGVDVTDLRELQRQVISISEEERENIGRELHDELGQILTGIGYLVKAMEEKVIEKDNIQVDEIATISGLVGKALDQTRNLARGLSRIQMQQNFSLALEEIVAELEGLYGVECVVSRTGEFKITDDTVATHLYYILKESVHNALKHGKSKIVFINIDVTEELFILNVLNQGDFSHFIYNSPRRGLGLKIMKYRSDILGGRFLVETTNESFSISLILERDLLE